MGYSAETFSLQSVLPAGHPLRLNCENTACQRLFSQLLRRKSLRSRRHKERSKVASTEGATSWICHRHGDHPINFAAWVIAHNPPPTILTVPQAAFDIDG